MLEEPEDINSSALQKSQTHKSSNIGKSDFDDMYDEISGQDGAARQQANTLQASYKQARSSAYSKHKISVISQPLSMQDMGLEAIGLDARKGGTVASVTTAFSAWNAMAGMGMVSMPWAFQQAGIVLGCILTVAAFLLSYATCWIYVQTAGKDIDYTITMRKAMGPCGYVFGMASFIINLLVPVILLFQLQAQSLAPILLAITNLSESDSLDTSVNWDSFSYTWTCVIILVLEFIITLRRDLEIFIIMNTYGVLGIIILFCYLMTTGFISISQTEYTASESYYDSHKDEISNLALIELFAAMYASLMGILGGGFYFHNLSIPVIAKNPEPKNNNRDLFFGYLLVCITYLMFGVVGYLGFMGQSYDDYRDENNDINQNALNMFAIKNVGANIVRFCVFAHLVTVNAVLFAFERSQIILLCTGKTESDSYAINITLNLLLMTPAFLLSVYYPNVGVLAGKLGAFATALVIYAVPTITFWVMKYQKYRSDEQHPYFIEGPDYYKLQGRSASKRTPAEGSMRSIKISDVDLSEDKIDPDKPKTASTLNESNHLGETPKDELDMAEFNKRVSKPTTVQFIGITFMTLGFITYGVYVFIIQVI